MHAHEDRLVVSVCVGSHGRESLGMNSSMQAMAGHCGAWGWTCTLSATVGVVACISLPCNPINSNTIPENAAPLAAPKTHRVRVEFVHVFLLAAHRVLLAGARRRPATNTRHPTLYPSRRCITDPSHFKMHMELVLCVRHSSIHQNR